MFKCLLFPHEIICLGLVMHSWEEILAKYWITSLLEYFRRGACFRKKILWDCDLWDGPPLLYPLSLVNDLISLVQSLLFPKCWFYEL